MKSIRLILSRLRIIPPVGKWDDQPRMIGGQCMKRRLKADGSFEYAPMSQQEQAEYVSNEAW